ncbi:MAG: PD-(D/E)XK nuclease-like domain-containing protein [Sphingomonas phyllosphaerae]|uniref:PD-(D/E)XK nuclease-like domain-containing protein n=1 Tax=Sphingomonas phyllosphaerae TaxID=257003 RepID=UPI002FF49457
MQDNPFAIDYAASADEASDSGVGEPAKSAIAAGIHHLTSAEYHADPAPLPSLSSTLAKVITTKSPLHAWHACRRLNPNYQSVERKTFDIGTAAHRALLGVGDDYVAIPDDLLAANGAASTAGAKAFIADARSKGRTPLKADEVAQVEAMRDAATSKLAEYGIVLDPARSEMAALAEIDGIWCRALFDNAPADPVQPIYDYKTCEDASPAACLKAIVNYGYDVQAALYLDVWKAVTGEDRRFVFIFQEKPAPHEVTLVTLSGAFRDVGEHRAKRARQMWAQCLSTNNWPGYPVGLHEIDAPAWLIERAYEDQN